MTTLRFCVLAAGFLFCNGWVVAQDDIEGAQDNPYFTRVPGFYIYETGDKDFDAYTFFDGKKLVTVEGKLYSATYGIKDDVKRPPSELQVRRNYIAAVKSQGGTVLFEGVSDAFEDTRSAATIVTARLGKQGKEIWLEVWPMNNTYTLTVLEKEAMRQEVMASDMLEAINKDGFIALDIHFDTGKATIRSESEPIVSQIVELLKQNGSLNLSIEGHTDNVGDAKSNKTLSENRAKAVMSAIVAAGISAGRLSAAGFGAEKPVADNRTEEGKAKNRRVELVKK